jgi:hypothetical protein
MLRQAHRDRSRRDLACLLAPVVAPAGYLLAALITIRLMHHPEAAGPWWFIGLASGLAAAGLCRWAPGFPGYHATAALGCYLAAVAAAASVATVSAARGARALIRSGRASG